MAKHYLQDESGRKFLLSTADDDIITEVGTHVFSLRGKPLSTYYDKQYKVLASAEGEVIVVFNSSVVAVLADFDPDFELGQDCNLEDVLLLDADEKKVLVYMEPGAGILNVGTEVYDDPCGNSATPDGEYYIYKSVLTVAGGIISDVRDAELDDPNGGLSDVILLTEDPKTGKPMKARVFIKNKADLITVGATIYDDEKAEKATPHTLLIFKEYYITLKEGVVVDVSKGKKPADDGKDE